MWIKSITNYNIQDSYLYQNKNYCYFDIGKIKFKENGIYLVELIYLPFQAENRDSYVVPYTTNHDYNKKMIINTNLYIENGQHILINKQDNMWTYMNNQVLYNEKKYEREPGTKPGNSTYGGILRYGVCGTLCFVKYKDGVLTRLTNEETSTKININVLNKMSDLHYLSEYKKFDYESEAKKNEPKTLIKKSELISTINDVNFNFGALIPNENELFGYQKIGKLEDLETLFSINRDNTLRLIFWKYNRWYNGFGAYNDWLWIRLASVGIYKLSDD